MPHFLSPAAGLLALLSLAAPLLLHLWRPPADTVRLGSLRFLQALTPPRRNLRWRERVLLLVRLALLALLALLLARPHWRHPAAPPNAAPRRWALLGADAPSLAGESLARLRVLRAAGYETRRLAPGFPVVTPDLIRPSSSVAAGSTPLSPPADLWSLLREADARLPAGSALAVFSPGRLAALRGKRPALSRCRVEWIETPAPSRDPGASGWLQALVFHPDAGELRATAVLSDALSTRFTLLIVPPPVGRGLHPIPGDSRIALETLPATGAGGSLSARLVPTDAGYPPGPWTPARVEKALHVLVFSDRDHSADARAIQAAARAAAQATGRGLTIHNLPAAPDLPADVPAPDWVFWLSATPVPAGIVRAAGEHGANLFSETETAPPVDTSSWIVPAPDAPGADALSAAPVRLWRRAALPPPSSTAATDHAPPAAATLWTDGTGEPLLTVATEGRVRHWRFHSRFDPAWSELAASTALPATLRGLFAGPAENVDVAPDPAHDLRLAGPAQSRPAEAPADPAGLPPLLVTDAANDPGKDMHGLFWGLAVPLFGVERAMSHRHRRRPATPAAANAAPGPSLAEVATRS